MMKNEATFWIVLAAIIASTSEGKQQLRSKTKKWSPNENEDTASDVTNRFREPLRKLETSVPTYTPLRLTPAPKTAAPTSAPTALKPICSRITCIGEILEGEEEGDRFGWSVSLSQTGSMTSVGSPYHDARSYFNGLVQTFEYARESDAWKQIGYDLTGQKDVEAAGWSVSLSGDGQWLAFGATAPHDTGYVKTFQNYTNQWVERGTTTVGEEKGDFYGGSVSISRNGQRVGVACHTHVTIYEFRRNDWVPMGGAIENGDLHTSVALSGDGYIVAVGFPGVDLRSKGHVGVYQWNHRNQWTQLGGYIVGDEFYDEFGWTLGISQNGHTLIVGTFHGNYASVYQYNDNDNDWDRIGDRITGKSSDNQSFGRSVSISDSGNSIIIGSPRFSSGGLVSNGRACVYERRDNSESWTQVAEEIIGVGNYDQVGYSVSISGNANYAAVGAPGADSYRGNAILFQI